MIDCAYIDEPDICFDNTMSQCWENGDVPTHYDKKDGTWYINGSRLRLGDWRETTTQDVMTYLMSCIGIVENLKVATTKGESSTNGGSGSG